MCGARVLQVLPSLLGIAATTQDEIEAAVASGAISEFHPAFSHEQKNFVFVQHKLLENKDAVWDLIANRGAYVYVCG